MKLFELVYLRNSLRSAINLSKIQQEITNNKDRLAAITSHVDDFYSSKIVNIAQRHENLFNHFDQTLEDVNELLKKIDSDIDNLTKKFFEDNYQKECFLNSPQTLRRDKILNLTDGADELLLSRIHLYSTWKYPALEIGCRDGEWTKHLVTFDPLYVTDNHDEFLNNAVSQFTPEYQRRIRTYKIHDFKIDNLPKNQFSFIFSFNYFNYLSLDSIKQFLIQTKEWLRPGGVILFTYNNADLSASAGLTENYFMTYVPKSMLLPMAESLGFDIVADVDVLPSTSWVELKKPGTLSTVKAHQALGEIKYY